MKTALKSAIWPWAAALVVLTGGVYATSFKGVFIYDDLSVMCNNLALRDWSHVDQILGAFYGRPVISVSFAIDYALFGSHPFGYHVVNLIAHLIAALSLFGIARRTLKNTPMAFTTALIWALHPLQTEAVTYIIQRCECMMGMFFLLSMYCVVRGAELERKTFWHGGAILAAALAAGCKQSAVVLPVVVVLYDRCFISGSFAAAMKRAPMLFAGLFASWFILYLSMALSTDKKLMSAGFGLEQLTAFSYARSQCVVIIHYLRLAMWPVGQCFDYTWPIENDFARIVPCALARVRRCRGVRSRFRVSGGLLRLRHGARRSAPRSPRRGPRDR